MIRINERYVITVDSMNYTANIDLHKADKDGKPMYKAIGYYGKFVDAINGIAEREVRENLSASAEMTLKEAVETMEAIYVQFTNILSDINRKASIKEG